MPSKKGIEQALTWLNSKAADNENTLDRINAELCINVIMDLQRQYDKLGIRYGTLSRKISSKDAEKYGEQMSFIK